MTDRIAEKDIIERNPLGQDVIVVPAGQPIPPGVEARETPAAPKPKAKKAGKRAKADE